MESGESRKSNPRAFRDDGIAAGIASSLATGSFLVLFGWAAWIDGIGVDSRAGGAVPCILPLLIVGPIYGVRSVRQWRRHPRTTLVTAAVLALQIPNAMLLLAIAWPVAKVLLFIR